MLLSACSFNFALLLLNGLTTPLPLFACVQTGLVNPLGSTSLGFDANLVSVTDTGLVNVPSDKLVERVKEIDTAP